MGNPESAGAGQSGLDSLAIRGFRGISQLEIPCLGRVTLLAGKNGVGKTTVLDAMRVYAARGHLEALRELLAQREELTTFRDEDGNLVDAPTFSRLFHRNGGSNASIDIGPVGGGRPRLKIKEHLDAEERVLNVSFDGAKRSYPEHHSVSSFRRRAFFGRDQDSWATPTQCESLGPGLLRSEDLGRLWDQVALTNDEALSHEALELVFGDGVEGAAVIGQGRLSKRRVVVKLVNHANPVPLRSLGDGATRMFGVAVALANCRDGILLIDEAENGIHYALQRKFWGMVLRAAEAHNTQVVATTHSKDCIDGFAAAALNCKEVRGNLIRIDRHNGKAHAVEYSKEELETAAEQNIEVR